MSFTIALGESVTLSGVSALREQILAALIEHDEVDIDASSLGEADLSLLQLLVAARLHAQGKDKALRPKGVPRELMDALMERAGFADGGDPDGFANWLQGDMPK